MLSNGHEENICVDFDGVIHGYAGYSDKIDGKPIDGSFQKLNEYLDAGYNVCILSARASAPVQVELMREWFDSNGFKRTGELRITAIKPAAALYIDDRAWRFDGDNMPTVEQVENSKPWWQKNMSNSMSDLVNIGERVARAYDALNRAKGSLLALDASSVSPGSTTTEPSNTVDNAVDAMSSFMGESKEKLSLSRPAAEYSRALYEASQIGDKAAIEELKSAGGGIFSAKDPEKVKQAWQKVIEISAEQRLASRFNDYIKKEKRDAAQATWEQRNAEINFGKAQGALGRAEETLLTMKSAGISSGAKDEQGNDIDLQKRLDDLKNEFNKDPGNISNSGKLLEFANRFNSVYAQASNGIKTATEEQKKNWAKNVFKEFSPEDKIAFLVPNAGSLQAVHMGISKDYNQFIEDLPISKDSKDILRDRLARISVDAEGKKGITGSEVYNIINSAKAIGDSDSFKGLQPAEKDVVKRFAVYRPNEDAKSFAAKVHYVNTSGNPEDKEKLAQYVDKLKVASEKADAAAANPTSREARGEADGAAAEANALSNAINPYAKRDEHLANLQKYEKQKLNAVNLQTSASKRPQGWSASENNKLISEADSRIKDAQQGIKDETAKLDKNPVVREAFQPQASASDQKQAEAIKNAPYGSSLYNANISVPAQVQPSLAAGGKFYYTHKGDYQGQKTDTSANVKGFDPVAESKSRQQAVESMRSTVASGDADRAAEQAAQNKTMDAMLSKTFSLLSQKYPFIPKAKLASFLQGDQSEINKYGQTVGVIRGADGQQVNSQGSLFVENTPSRLAQWNEKSKNDLPGSVVNYLNGLKGKAPSIPAPVAQTLTPPPSGEPASVQSKEQNTQGVQALEGLKLAPPAPPAPVNPGSTLKNTAKTLLAPSGYTGNNPVVASYLNSIPADQRQEEARKFNAYELEQRKVPFLAPGAPAISAVPRMELPPSSGVAPTPPVEQTPNKGTDNMPKPEDNTNSNEQSAMSDASTLEMLEAFGDTQTAGVLPLLVIPPDPVSPKNKRVIASDTGAPISGDMQNAKIKKCDDSIDDAKDKQSIESKNKGIKEMLEAKKEEATTKDGDGNDGDKKTILVIKKDGDGSEPKSENKQDGDDGIPPEFQRPSPCWNDELKSTSPNVLQSIIGLLGEEDDGDESTEGGDGECQCQHGGEQNDKTESEKQEDAEGEELLEKLFGQQDVSKEEATPVKKSGKMHFRDMACADGYPCMRFSDEAKKASGKCPGGSCIHNEGGKWRIYSAKDSHKWPQEYDSKEHALSALRGYQASKGKQ